MEERQKPLRSDARKRRKTLLDAASEVFARQGCGVSLDAVAARAGVGHGTLYRNFADRNELLFALVQRELAQLEEALRGIDPVDHPMALIEAMAERAVVNPSAAEAWTAMPVNAPRPLAYLERFHALASQGLEPAKAAGRLRPELTVADFALIGIMFRAISASGGEAQRRAAKQRVLAILTQGLVPDQPAAGLAPEGSMPSPRR